MKINNIQALIEGKIDWAPSYGRTTSCVLNAPTVLPRHKQVSLTPATAARSTPNSIDIPIQNGQG
ncbi:hypothetical protein J6590_047147 [Homalodisca vitripennis]|nr:hypothetical protein J6590_047147 [Homalodisca vitripennis]